MCTYVYAEPYILYRSRLYVLRTDFHCQPAEEEATAEPCKHCSLAVVYIHAHRVGTYQKCRQNHGCLVRRDSLNAVENVS